MTDEKSSYLEPVDSLNKALARRRPGTPAPVFDLPYRPDEAHDRVSGVRLTLAQPAVQALDGRIVVRRKPGLGSESGWSHRGLAKSLLPPPPLEPNS